MLVQLRPCEVIDSNKLVCIRMKLKPARYPYRVDGQTQIPVVDWIVKMSNLQGQPISLRKKFNCLLGATNSWDDLLD